MALTSSVVARKDTVSAHYAEGTRDSERERGRGQSRQWRRWGERDSPCRDRNAGPKTGLKPTPLGVHEKVRGLLAFHLLVTPV